MPDVVETLPDTITAADDALLSGSGEPQPADTPAAEPQPAPPDTPPTGPARDDQGRFTVKPPPAPETPPAPDAGPSPGAEPPAEPVAAAPPFAFQADGQEIPIQGSLVGADGIFIPTAEVPRITRLLQEGHAWQHSAQRYFSEVNQRQQALESRAKTAEEQAQAAEAQLTAVLEHFEKLVEASIGTTTPEELLATPLAKWLLDVRSNWGVLKAESRATRIERERQSDARRLEEYEKRQRDAELKPQMAKTLSDHILYLGQQAQLDRDTMEAIYADLMSPEYEGVTWIAAPQDDPLNGIKKGETVLNLGIVQREVERAKRILAPHRVNGQPKAAQPTAPAPVKKPTVPPTVSATRGPAPKKSGGWVPKTKEEADEALLYGSPED